MSKERMVIIVLLASLLVTNLGWIYISYVQNQGSTPTDEFEMKLQELRNEKCSLRLLYTYSFEEYKQRYEDVYNYTFTEVNWATYKDKIKAYEERKGVKAAAVYPGEGIFEVTGEDYTQHYYHQVE